MKTGRYSFRELLLHQEIEQIIIPEVQRDYVWQTENVRRLLDNIIQFHDDRHSLRLEISINGLPNGEVHLISHLQKELERLQYHLKLGFIYAYHDPSYPGKFFLIDGQQRFTTLYLLLLALYKKAGRQEDFKYSFFPGEQLKIDYKVRRAAHDFMRDFVKHELSEESHDFTKSKYYYRQYDQDVTIRNLLANYRFITTYIQSKTHSDRTEMILCSFLEDFVELNFFNTQLSAQGEQLYLYMNARGEQLSFQEEIKSTVVSRLSSDDKRRAGQAWEDWQNFFWRHRQYENDQEQLVSRDNADIGFQEFLKWATIIQVATSTDEQLIVYLNSQMGNLRRSSREIKTFLITRSRQRELEQLRVLENYQLDRSEFSFDYLSGLANAIIDIYDLHGDTVDDFMKSAYLANDFQASSYVVICPLLYFFSHVRQTNAENKLATLRSMGMWLKNLTYFSSTIGRRPDDSTIYLLEIVKLMIEEKETDITTLLTLVEPNRYTEILPIHERNRLTLLKRHGLLGLEFNKRDELEQAMWEVTNDKKTNAFLEGNMSILFDCVAYDFSVTLDELIFESEHIKVFRDYHMLFREFILPDSIGNLGDLLRRAMLTFGDYSLQQSGTWTFGNYINKYTFLSNSGEWRMMFADEDQKTPFLKMMNDLRSTMPGTDYESKRRYLLSQVALFNDKKDWRYPFIKHNLLMNYMQDKKFLYENVNHIVLLSKTIMSAAYCDQSLLIFIAGTRLRAKYDQANSTIFIDLKENKKLPDPIECIIINETDRWHWGIKNSNAISVIVRNELIDKGWSIEDENIFPKSKELFIKDANQTVAENSEIAASSFINELEALLPILENAKAV